MLIIGEKINSSSRKVAEAIRKRDSQFILGLARKQKEAGADFIDVNAGTLMEKEKESMEWLVRTIQEALEVPLSIDSPNPEVLRRGLELHKGKAFLNSLTGEKDRMESVLPLILEFRPLIIALCMDEGGIPTQAEERLLIAQKITETLTSQGVAEEEIFFDPIIRPVGAEPEAGKVALETIALIKEKIPRVKTICGLSNISFGLPIRGLLNSVFLALAMGKGLDGAILDPTDKRIQEVLIASGVLTAEDPYSLNYIRAYREGRIGP